MHKSIETKGRALPAVALAIVAALVLAGCNTVKGAGKDIESAGEAMQDAAD